MFRQSDQQLFEIGVFGVGLHRVIARQIISLDTKLADAFADIINFTIDR